MAETQNINENVQANEPGRSNSTPNLAYDIATEIMVGGDRFDHQDLSLMLGPVTEDEIAALREGVRAALASLDPKFEAGSKEYYDKQVEYWTSGHRTMSAEEKAAVLGDFDSALNFARSLDALENDGYGSIEWAFGRARSAGYGIPELKEKVLESGLLDADLLFDFFRHHILPERNGEVFASMSSAEKETFDNLWRDFASAMTRSDEQFDREGRDATDEEYVRRSCRLFVSEHTDVPKELLSAFAEYSPFRGVLSAEMENYGIRTREQLAQVALDAIERYGARSYSKYTERKDGESVSVQVTDLAFRTRQSTDTEYYIPVNDIFAAREKGLSRRSESEIASGVTAPENANTDTMRKTVLDYYVTTDENGRKRVAHPFSDALTERSPFTRPVRPEIIVRECRALYENARLHPDRTYYIDFDERKPLQFMQNGYLVAEMAEMFKAAGPIPQNVLFPQEWVESRLFMSREQRREMHLEEKEREERLRGRLSADEPAPTAEELVDRESELRAGEAERPAFEEVNGYRTYDGAITPDGNVVMVFGSNTEGRHGCGAAEFAVRNFGAVYGQAEGLQGNSWAIVTKDLPKSAEMGIYSRPTTQEHRTGVVAPMRAKWDAMEVDVKKYYRTHPFTDVLTDRNPAQRSVSPERIIEQARLLYKAAEAQPERNFALAWSGPLREMSLCGYMGGELMAMFNAAGPIPENVVVPKAWALSDGLEQRLSPELAGVAQRVTLSGYLELLTGAAYDETVTLPSPVAARVGDRDVNLVGVIRRRGSFVDFTSDDGSVVPGADVDPDALSAVCGFYSGQAEVELSKVDTDTTARNLLPNCVVNDNGDGTFIFTDNEGTVLHKEGVATSYEVKLGVVNAVMEYPDGSTGRMRITANGENNHVTLFGREAPVQEKAVVEKTVTRVRENLPKVYTIGTGVKTTQEYFLEAKSFGVTDIFDVRSVTRSRNPDFSGDRFDESCKANGIVRTYEGNRAGGHPDGNLAGEADYAAMAAEPQFDKFLEELAAAASEPGRAIALTCSESSPSRCHRALLIGQELERRGLAQMVHITGIGRSETQRRSVERVVGEDISLSGADERTDYLRFNFTSARDQQGNPIMKYSPVPEGTEVKGIYERVSVKATEKVETKPNVTFDEEKEIPVQARYVIEQDPSWEYRPRTIRNASNSDVTLAFAADSTTPGEKLTRRAAGDKCVSVQIDNRKFANEGFTPDVRIDADRLLDVGEIGRVATEIISAMEQKGLPTREISANFAGNALATLEKAGISNTRAKNFTAVLVRSMMQQGVTFREIRSGFQTGFDEYGIHAAIYYGVPARLYMPNNCRRQNPAGTLNSKGDVESVYGEMHVHSVLESTVRKAEKREETERLNNMPAEERAAVIEKRRLEEEKDAVSLIIPIDEQERTVAAKAADHLLSKEANDAPLQAVRMFVSAANSANICEEAVKVEFNKFLSRFPNEPDEVLLKKNTLELELNKSYLSLFTNRVDGIDRFGFAMTASDDDDRRVLWEDVAQFFTKDETVYLLALKDNDRSAAVREKLSGMQSAYADAVRMMEGIVAQTQKRVDAAKSVAEKAETGDVELLWGRFAEDTPSIELSSTGLKKYSALNMRFDDRTFIYVGGERIDASNRTVEDVYQKSIKKSSKGKRPAEDSILNKGFASAAEAEDYAYSQAYLPLVQIWAQQNPVEVMSLKDSANTLAAEGKHAQIRFTDQFATTRVSQARAWADIINDAEVSSRRVRFNNLALGSSSAVRPAPATMEDVKEKPFVWPAERTVVFVCTGDKGENLMKAVVPSQTNVIVDARANCSNSKYRHLSSSGLKDQAASMGAEYRWKKSMSRECTGPKAEQDIEAILNEAATGKRVTVIASGKRHLYSPQAKGLAQELERRGCHVVWRDVNATGEIIETAQKDVMEMILEQRGVYIAQGDFRQIHYQSVYDDMMYVDESCVLAKTVHSRLDEDVELFPKERDNYGTPTAIVVSKKYDQSEVLREIRDASSVTISFGGDKARQAFQRSRHDVVNLSILGDIKYAESRDGITAPALLRDPDYARRKAVQALTKIYESQATHFHDPFFDMKALNIAIVGPTESELSIRRTSFKVSETEIQKEGADASSHRVEKETPQELMGLTGESLMNMYGLRSKQTPNGDANGGAYSSVQDNDISPDDIATFSRNFVGYLNDPEFVKQTLQRKRPAGSSGADEGESRQEPVMGIASIRTDGDTGIAEAMTNAAKFHGITNSMYATHDFKRTVNDGSSDGTVVYAGKRGRDGRMSRKAAEAFFINPTRLGHKHEIGEKELKAAAAERRHAYQYQMEGELPGLTDRQLLALHLLGMSNRDITAVNTLAADQFVPDSETLSVMVGDYVGAFNEERDELQQALSDADAALSKATRSVEWYERHAPLLIETARAAADDSSLDSKDKKIEWIRKTMKEKGDLLRAGEVKVLDESFSADLSPKFSSWDPQSDTAYHSRLRTMRDAEAARKSQEDILAAYDKEHSLFPAAAIDDAMKRADEMVAKAAESGASLCTINDSRYPKNWKDSGATTEEQTFKTSMKRNADGTLSVNRREYKAFNPVPALIWYRGDLSVTQGPTVAVAGATASSPEAIARGRNFGASCPEDVALVACVDDQVVLSRHIDEKGEEVARFDAPAADASALGAFIEKGGKGVVVLPTSLDDDISSELRRRNLANGGVEISEVGAIIDQENARRKLKANVSRSKKLVAGMGYALTFIDGYSSARPMSIPAMAAFATYGIFMLGYKIAGRAMDGTQEQRMVRKYNEMMGHYDVFDRYADTLRGLTPGISDADIVKNLEEWSAVNGYPKESLDAWRVDSRNRGNAAAIRSCVVWGVNQGFKNDMIKEWSEHPDKAGVKEGSRIIDDPKEEVDIFRSAREAAPQVAAAQEQEAAVQEQEVTNPNEYEFNVMSVGGENVFIVNPKYENVISAIRKQYGSDSRIVSPDDGAAVYRNAMSGTRTYIVKDENGNDVEATVETRRPYTGQGMTRRAEGAAVGTRFFKDGRIYDIAGLPDGWRSGVKRTKVQREINVANFNRVADSFEAIERKFNEALGVTCKVDTEALHVEVDRFGMQCRVMQGTEERLKVFVDNAGSLTLKQSDPMSDSFGNANEHVKVTPNISRLRDGFLPGSAVSTLCADVSGSVLGHTDNERMDVALLSREELEKYREEFEHGEKSLPINNMDRAALDLDRSATLSPAGPVAVSREDAVALINRTAEYESGQINKLNRKLSKAYSELKSIETEREDFIHGKTVVGNSGVVTKNDGIRIIRRAGRNVDIAGNVGEEDFNIRLDEFDSRISAKRSEIAGIRSDIEDAHRAQFILLDDRRDALTGKSFSAAEHKKKDRTFGLVIDGTTVSVRNIELSEAERQNASEEIAAAEKEIASASVGVKVEKKEVYNQETGVTEMKTDAKVEELSSKMKGLSAKASSLRKSLSVVEKKMVTLGETLASAANGTPEQTSARNEIAKCSTKREELLRGIDAVNAEYNTLDNERKLRIATLSPSTEVKREENRYEVVTRDKDGNELAFNGLYLMYNPATKRYAYANEDMEIVSAEYARAYPFGLEVGVVVDDNGHKNFINREGKEISPIFFDNIFIPNGSSITDIGAIVKVERDGMFNYIDLHSGNLLLEKEMSKAVTRFSNGVGIFEARPCDGPDAFIHDEDDRVIGPKYGFVTESGAILDVWGAQMSPFRIEDDGKAYGYFRNSDDEPWQQVDSDGHVTGVRRQPDEVKAAAAVIIDARMKEMKKPESRPFALKPDKK